MKIELGAQRPEYFKEDWPGEYDLFSHFEFACGIPSVLFTISTLKENGKTNVNFCGWSSFSGDGNGFYAILPGLRHSHTYKNIMRTGEFVINFINKNYFDACIATINDNSDDTDEFTAGGFTQEKAQTVGCPRISEAFMCLECKFEKEVEIGSSSIIIGKVMHIAAQEEYAKGIDERHGDNGFMMNIDSPKNLLTGEGNASAVAVCKVVRINKEG